MSDSNEILAAPRGEAPETLSYLQVLLAQVVLAGTALLLLSILWPTSVPLHGLMLATAAATLVLAIPRFAALGSLRAHERVTLAMLCAAIAVLAWVGFSGLS